MEAAVMERGRRGSQAHVKLSKHIFPSALFFGQTDWIQSGHKAAEKQRGFELDPSIIRGQEMGSGEREQDTQDLRSCVVGDGFLNVFRYPALSLKAELPAEHVSASLPDKHMQDGHGRKTDWPGASCRNGLPFHLITFITLGERQISQHLQHLRFLFFSKPVFFLSRISLSLSLSLSHCLAPCWQWTTSAQVCVMSWDDSRCWDGPHWVRPNASVEGDSPRNNATLISASNSLCWASSLLRQKMNSCLLSGY